MDYASLLVHVESGSTSSDARLKLAVSLARRFQARLIGVAAGAVQPPPAVDAYGSMVMTAELMEVDEEQIRAELTAAEACFRSALSSDGVPNEWRSAMDFPADVLAREGRAADLVVVGRDLERLRRGVYRSADPGELLMSSGRPVLVVPPGTDALSARYVVIGWKDAREARRAVWDAMPFLQRAENVHVVEVAPEDDLEFAANRIGDVVRHLKRHHVKAEGEARARREASEADELILVAEQIGADLIVAGGYGHARLREWVFGGVTHDLLKHSPKCVLLSH